MFLFLFSTAVVSVIVAVIVLLRGGRYERLVVAFGVVRDGLYYALLLIWWPHPHPQSSFFFAVLAANKFAYLLAVGWLVWRHRAPWLKALVGFQAIRVGLTVVMAFIPATAPHLTPLNQVFWLASTGCLAWALLLRNVGPPIPVPGQAAFEARMALSSARNGAGV